MHLSLFLTFDIRQLLVLPRMIRWFLSSHLLWVLPWSMTTGFCCCRKSQTTGARSATLHVDSDCLCWRTSCCTSLLSVAHISLPTMASNTCSQPAWPHAAPVSNTVWHQGAHSHHYHCNRTTKTSTLFKLCSWTLFRSISALCLRLCTSRDSACEPLWLHPLGQTQSPWASALLPRIIPQNWQLQCSKSSAPKQWKLKDYMG